MEGCKDGCKNLTIIEIKLLAIGRGKTWWDQPCSTSKQVEFRDSTNIWHEGPKEKVM
jgi:hypothetical protein